MCQIMAMSKNLTKKGKVDPNDIQGDFDWLNLLVLNSAETASPLG